MAQAGVVLDKDQFTCSVCLDVLRDPVTIPCGHSYCSDCIRNYWDQDDYLGVFMCPQCRQSFSPRPALARSTLLADVVDRFQRSGLQEVPAGGGGQQQQSLAEAGDVECDVCPGRKNKAVNSCLVCLASYCELHVRPHHDSAVFKKHKLVSASKRLQESVCQRHDKLLEVYCRTDKQCICSMCLADEHKGHDTVLVEVEIQVQQRSARLATETSDGVFTDLVRSMELKRFEVRELIKAQQKQVVSQAERLLEKIQKQITEQKKREADLDRLTLADDHLHFLQSCQALEALPPATSPIPAIAVEPGLTFDSATKAVCDFKSLLQEVCQDGFVSIYEKVREVVITAPPNLPVHIDVTGHSGNVTVPLAEIHPPVQMEETGFLSPGLDQSHMSPLNPFLSPGPVVPMFVFSPFGSKLSTGSRQRHNQRRTHARKK
ncbi:E3 ubiquitin/ISG15 ligase TRIM25-like isoform X3 [Syngnathus acus]|uniref:E3 ubiquitin/ISG15 ligase TRIM25-like isoform X3 n=1 Tax=Syngnathus acus TaxID=161584 RepID=UPI001885B90A|nr:E3 ubiquitin/ISG15 ligase TRIM25-like isoform X3 [Syngnathus acus]